MSSARQTRVSNPCCLREMLGSRDGRRGDGRRCRVFERGSPKSVVVAAVSIPIHPIHPPLVRTTGRERKSARAAIERLTILRTFVRHVSGDSMFLSFAQWFGGGGCCYLPGPGFSRGYL